MPRRVEQAYVAGLVAFFQRFHTRYVHAALVHHDADRATMLDLELGISAEVSREVPLLYGKMALEVRMANREAAVRALGLMPGADLEIERAVLIAREANIRLVEDALRAYAASVREVLSDPTSFGLGVEALKERLLAKGDISEARAELIARDQTLKLNGQVNAARQRAAGVEEYTWSTVGDERVRPSHRALDGKRFRWDSPPEPMGHPGEDFQCRCVPIAVLDEFAGI